MCFRKAAVVVPLLQGLAKVQIVSHSRFAAKMEFDISHLREISDTIALMKKRGGYLIVRALEDEGVRFTFGIPGTHTIELYDALQDSSQIEPILVASELGAAFMADGLARTTGEIGVLTVVPGAGVTHCLSGVAEAFMDQVPMVVIAAGVRTDTGHAYQLHAIDQMRVLEPVTKAVFQIKSASEIYATVRRAFEVARNGIPGPVAVEVPANFLMLTQEVHELVFEPHDFALGSPDADLVELAAKMLGDARLPAIYLGRGAEDATAQAVALAEQLGAPVVTTISGKGVFPENHELWLWNGWGPQAPAFVTSIVDRCDCLLAIGCRFGEVATGSYGMRLPEKLIHVDLDPEVFHQNYRAQLVIEGDASLFLNALLSLIEGKRPSDELRTEIAAGHRKVKARVLANGNEKKVNPAKLLAALQQHCNANAIFSVDSGNGAFLSMENLRLEASRRFIGPIDFSCMGYSIPAAIGAAFGNPERDVVAIVGDGALLMTGLETLTAANYGAAPLIVVLRDGKLGQIAQFQKIPFNRQTCAHLPDYSLEDLARAVGASYFRIIRDAELDTVLPAAIHLVRDHIPVIVEVCFDDERKSYFTKGVLKTTFLRFSWGDRLRMLVRALMRRF